MSEWACRRPLAFCHLSQSFFLYESVCVASYSYYKYMSHGVTEKGPPASRPRVGHIDIDIDIDIDVDGGTKPPAPQPLIADP